MSWTDLLNRSNDIITWTHCALGATYAYASTSLHLGKLRLCDIQLSTVLPCLASRKPFFCLCQGRTATSSSMSPMLYGTTWMRQKLQVVPHIYVLKILPNLYLSFDYIPSRTNTWLKFIHPSWWIANCVTGPIRPARRTPWSNTWKSTQANFLNASLVVILQWMRGCSSAMNSATKTPFQFPQSANVAALTNYAKLYSNT